MKRIFTILFVTAISISGFAQQNNNEQPNGSKLEALKIAFLTRKLDLSPDEAQRFWPIYNDYSKEIREIIIDKRSGQSSELKTQEQILEIRKKYNTEFSRVLSAEKVDTFFRSEKEFRNYVKKELSDRKEQRQQSLKPSR